MPLDPDLKNHVDYLQDHAHHLRAVIAMTDAIKGIASIEQAANEAESRKADAETVLGLVEAEIEKAKLRRGKVDEDVAEAQKQAASIIATAKADADGILAKANRDAEEIRSKADADAKQKAGAAAAAALQASEQLATIEGQIVDAKEELAGVKAEAEDVTRRADEAKAYLAKLAGG
jgi:chromosome segregation ATPase